MNTLAAPSDRTAPPILSPPPVVDVIIAAWNRADTIERAITSAARAKSVGLIVVVDDASTDDTALRAEILAETLGGIVVLRQPRNGGPSAARNRALAVCTAPWVAVLDGDDYLESERFTRLLALADDWDFVADDLLQIAEGAPPYTARALLNVDESWPERVELAAFAAANINRSGRRQREMGFLKPIMRRAFLLDHGLIYNPAVRLGEDYLLYAAALAAGARFRLTAAAGYVAVLRPDSLSARHSRQDLEALLRGDRALARLPTLTRPERRAVRRHCRHIEAKIQWLAAIEAVKQREAGRLLRALSGPPSVSLSVAGKLLEQVWLRGRATVHTLMERTCSWVARQA